MQNRNLDKSKYKNKYRIQSHRKPGWDYSGNGYYFITLVTMNRKCLLGEIVGKNDHLVETHGRASLQPQQMSMVLSNYGKIVEIEWYKSFEIRNELILDECIIMPNHLHAIIILEKPKLENKNYSLDPSYLLKNNNVTAPQSSFFRKPKSLSSFVGGFKSVINTKIDDYIDENKLNISKYNRNNHFFQSNYHDHIIKNNDDYLRIKNYIINNPDNWKNDSLYTSH